MTKSATTIEAEAVEHDSFYSTTTIAALLLLAAKFPHRQFNSAELCVLSGVGRTAMSQIKNAKDTPFSLGKCTLQRLDAWLANHPLQGVADRSRHDVPSPALSAVAKRVTFPYQVWRLADVRWQDLGYRSLSAYITGLIRYDLLVSGPHSTITADCRSKIQRALTRKTLAARRKGDRRKILLDHLIERAEGRPVTYEELEKMKAQIAQTLRNISLKG